MLNRRDFLRSAALVTAAMAIRPQHLLSADDVPVLYGDGVHDDTVAVQALLDRRPVRYADSFRGRVERDGESLTLRDGTFYVTSPVRIAPRTTLIGNYWRSPESGAILATADCVIEGNHISG